MKTIFIIIAVLLGVNINAQDVSVTAFDAYPPSNRGSLEVDINPFLGNAPFTITVTRNSSVTHTETVLGYNWTLGNLPPGYYCIHIEGEDGCAASVCITIDKCTNWLGNVHCFSQVEYENNEHVIVAGEPLDGENGNLTSPGNEDDYIYVWYTSIDSFMGSQLSDALMDSTHYLVSDLLTNGSTPYDTSHQNDINNPNAAFIISFDVEHQKINWVWHNFSQNQYRLIMESQDENKLIQVFPNPTNSTFTTKWPKGQFVTLKVVDNLGRKILTQNLDSSAKEETFSFESKHPSGLYFLLLESVDGSIFSEKIMLIRDN
ncbi:MAG: T9SS C-terminal target domain-containing protein [Saprospirales bacterium]|nr:MAG: T9SS C-terminal target domain-containing protein [Saprospirales bacterium]